MLGINVEALSFYSASSMQKELSVLEKLIKQTGKGIDQITPSELVQLIREAELVNVSEINPWLAENVRKGVISADVLKFNEELFLSRIIGINEEVRSKTTALLISDGETESVEGAMLMEALSQVDRERKEKIR